MLYNLIRPLHDFGIFIGSQKRAMSTREAARRAARGGPCAERQQGRWGPRDGTNPARAPCGHRGKQPYLGQDYSLVLRIYGAALPYKASVSTFQSSQCSNPHLSPKTTHIQHLCCFHPLTLFSFLAATTSPKGETMHSSIEHPPCAQGHLPAPQPSPVPGGTPGAATNLAQTRGPCTPPGMHGMGAGLLFSGCRGSKTRAPGEPGTSSSTGCIRPVWAIALHDEPLSARFQQLTSTTTIRIYKSCRQANNSPFQAERSGFTCRAARWHWAAPSCTRHHRMSPGQILPYSLIPAALISRNKIMFLFSTALRSDLQTNHTSLGYSLRIQKSFPTNSSSYLYLGEKSWKGKTEVITQIK